MNILYFLNFYPTKHKIVAHDEMLEMTRRGHQIAVVAVWGGEKDKTEGLPFKVHYLENKIRLLRILLLFFKFGKKGFKHILLLKKYLGFRDSLKFFSVYHFFLNTNPDHIHAHFANNAALKAYLLSKFLDVPFSCTGHGSELLLYPEPYLPELITDARPFITISNYNKRQLMERYSLPEDSIVVNYCGIDMEYFKKDVNLRPEKYTITSVSALKDVKGLKYLIQACKVLNDRDLPFKCQIIGGGPDHADLQELINCNNLSQKVELLGVKSENEIKVYLDNSSIFVLPSLSEGIPVAVMEAMAMRLPVIATNITGLPEIIENGVNGYLVPPKDPEALAEKIIELYKNPGLREKFGKVARKTIEQKFNLQKNITRFEELITAQI
jgi:glycosyltransferase involved in cell wall biosynthesis